MARESGGGWQCVRTVKKMTMQFNDGRNCETMDVNLPSVSSTPQTKKTRVGDSHKKENIKQSWVIK